MSAGISECILRDLPVGILTEQDRVDLRFLLETRANLLTMLRLAALATTTLHADRSEAPPPWVGEARAVILKAGGWS
mgnify:CR=1